MAGRQMPEMRVASIHIGPVETRLYDGRPTRTAAHKRPVAEARLTQSGFEGDRQADLRHHGGPEKAVCIYSADHYPYWEREWGVPLAHGAFGENLTLAGMREEDVCIGDVIRLGGTTIQVTQPRQPCSKLAARHGRLDLIAAIRQNGFSGFYARVLEGGLVRAGDMADILSTDPAAVSVGFAHRVMHRQLEDRGSLDRLLSVQALSEAWREVLSKR